MKSYAFYANKAYLNEWHGLRLIPKSFGGIFSSVRTPDLIKKKWKWKRKREKPQKHNVIQRRACLIYEPQEKYLYHQLIHRLMWSFYWRVFRIWYKILRIITTSNQFNCFLSYHALSLWKWSAHLQKPTLCMLHCK